MKNNKTRYICDFEGCRHRNEENVCCLFNQENCILFRTKRELEEVKANADYQLEGRDVTIKELEEQIEKMKCCNNCFYDCEDCNSKNKDCNKCSCGTCVKHNHWELRR